MSYPVYPYPPQRNHPRSLSTAQSRSRSVEIIDAPSSSAFYVTIFVDYILSAQSRSSSAEINDATSSSALSRSISFDYILHWFLYSLQQVCHRNLKLENTLLDGSPAPILKICDFGYSKRSMFLYGFQGKKKNDQDKVMFKQRYVSLLMFIVFFL
ncbi:hypothetical protein R6Q59_019009 [Mikania micrantha]